MKWNQYNSPFTGKLDQLHKAISQDIETRFSHYYTLELGNNKSAETYIGRITLGPYFSIEQYIFWRPRNIFDITLPPFAQKLCPVLSLSRRREKMW
jgi:hypothetical protein